MANSAKIQSFWLGAPLIDLDRRAFESALLARFSSSKEYALAHVDKLSERLAAKARTILVFDALLIGLYPLSSAAVSQPRLFALAGLLAVFSALLMLSGMYMPWAAARDQGSVDREFRVACDTLYRRSITMTFALAATALATFAAAVPLLVRFAP